MSSLNRLTRSQRRRSLAALPRRRWLRAKQLSGVRFGVFLSMALATVGASARAAEFAPPTIDAIRVGFNGRYKLGFWTPVEVQLSAGAHDVRGDLVVIVPDGDGAPTRVVERGVALKAGEKRGTRLFIKLGRPHAAIRVALRAGVDHPVLAERIFSGDEVPTALGAGSKSGASKLILEMGSPLDFGSAIRFNEEGEPEETAVVYLDEPSQWPDRWDGYDGVDLVVLTTGQPKIYRQLPVAAIDALDRWLHLGGRMLISVGKHGPELLADGMPLARFAPGRFIETLPLRRFGALENFTGSTEPLDSAEGGHAGGRATMDVARLSGVRGRIEAFEAARPEDVALVVRSGAGFGKTLFVAADLNEPPLVHWKARPELLAILTGRNPGAVTAPTIVQAGGQGTQFGYDDLIGQLRAALDQFPGVRLVPFWLVAALAVGYMLLLFPLDYLLGTKLVHRNSSGGSAWPWIRFGGLVAVVSLGACLLGSRWKGDQLQASQADVIDFDVESGLTRGNSFLSLYSPSSRAYSLELHPLWHGPQKEPADMQLSWLGLPGGGLGGMNAPAAELPLFTEPYDLSPRSAVMSSVPLATWSSKCFTGRWAGQGSELVAADLHENADRQLAGSIRLAEGFADRFKLIRCVLFYDRWAYVIDSFSAAEPISVERLEARTSETLLTERHSVGDKDQTKPYDRGSLVRERILRIMMFYKTAGGRKYTGFFNRYEHELDFSDQLAPGMGRAVLVGVGPPAAELRVDGQLLPGDSSAEHLTIYRFVLPVQRPSQPPVPSPQSP